MIIVQKIHLKNNRMKLLLWFSYFSKMHLAINSYIKYFIKKL